MYRPDYTIISLIARRNLLALILLYFSNSYLELFRKFQKENNKPQYSYDKV